VDVIKSIFSFKVFFNEGPFPSITILPSSSGNVISNLDNIITLIRETSESKKF
jgi:hypothetical protein